MVNLLRSKELVGLGFQGYLRSPPRINVLDYVIHHVPELLEEEICDEKARMMGNISHGKSSVSLLLDFSLEPKRLKKWSIRRPFRLGKLFHDFKFFMVADNLASLVYAFDDLVVRGVEGLKRKENYTLVELDSLRRETVRHCLDFYRKNFGAGEILQDESYLRIRVPA